MCLSIILWHCGMSLESKHIQERECWVVAELSHTAFCSSRTHGSGYGLGPHRSNAACSRGNVREFALPSFQRLLLLLPNSRLRREGLVGAFLPIPWDPWRSLSLLLKLWTCPVPPFLWSRRLRTSRPALGLSPPVLVDDGPRPDEQAVGRTGCPDVARILEG